MSVNIIISDILDELRDENIRLKADLLLAQNYIQILIQFKNYFQNNCKCLSNDKQLVEYQIQLNSICHQLVITSSEEVIHQKETKRGKQKRNSIKEKNIDNNESERKSARIVCENCGKSFRYLKALETHRTRVHNNHNSEDTTIVVKRVGKERHVRNKTCFHCTQSDCQFKTFSKQNFKDHNNVHNNETPYACDQCGKQFNYLNSFLNHKKHVHTEKVHTCSWVGCEFSTKWKHRLDSHCATHLGDKPLKCDWPGCEFSTAYSNKLKNHKYRHTGEKPYKCLWPECEWVFREKGHLNTHMLKHTGHKPWTCAECGQRFQTKQAMRFHHQRRHPHS